MNSTAASTVSWTNDISPKLLHTLLEAPKVNRLALCSNGGDLHICAAVVDLVRRRKMAVTGTGLVASAATPILAAGAPGRRVVTPSTRIMVHSPTMSTSGPATGVRADLRDLEWYVAWMAHVFADATHRDYHYWADLLSRPGDTYFDAEEAVETGLADSVAS